MFNGDQQLPTGPGLDAPTQPPLTNMEPDLPARRVVRRPPDIRPVQSDLEDFAGAAK